MFYDAIFSEKVVLIFCVKMELFSKMWLSFFEKITVSCDTGNLFCFIIVYYLAPF